MNKLEQAMDFHKSGNLQEADHLYQEMIQEEPDNADVKYLYATLKMTKNELNESLQAIDEAIEINDKAPAFFQLKGSVLARLGKPNEALDALNQALKTNPNLYQSHIVAGHLNYSLGERNKAQVHFKSALKINEENPEAHVNLARLMIDDGDVENAINTLRDVELKHPEQASVKMMLGQAFIENGAYSYAENYFQKVLAMQPENELAGLLLGVAKLNTGDMNNAEKLILTFNKTYQNTREGLAAMGLWLFKNNKFKAASGYLQSAIGKGLAPLSWKAAYVESLARQGNIKPAVEFYEQRQAKKPNGVITYRLGELYESQGKYKKAIDLYSALNPQDIKYLASLLGIARCYIHLKDFEKSKESCRKVLEKNVQHAEATYLLITSYLELEETQKALDILENLPLETYSDSYKRVFNLLLGLIYDNKENYEKAFETFKKNEKRELPEFRKILEEEVKQIQGLNTKVSDDLSSPIFVVGSNSTSIHEFINWLYANQVKVLNDRLVTTGRQDILHSYVEIEKIISADDEMVKLERSIYKEKAKALLAETTDDFTVVDSLYINPYQLGLVKKFFPDSTVLLLDRDTPDIWLAQQVYGNEPIDSKEWNEAKNQIISMGLNLIQVNTDKWMENDNETHKKLREVFNKDLSEYTPKSDKYWAQTRFPSGHWKNYKAFLGN